MKRFRLPLAIAAITAIAMTAGAHAQEAIPAPPAAPPRIECESQPMTNVHVGKAVAALPWATVATLEGLVRQGRSTDVARFFDRASDGLLSATAARCGAGGKMEYVRAFVTGSDFKGAGDLFWGEYDLKNGKWNHRQFNVDLSYRVEQARLNDLSQPAAMKDLASRTSATVVEPNVLWQNPYVYKDRVVVLRTDFERMIDQDHAAFEFNHEIHVGGVPATKFRSHGEVALVAVKVTGSETVHGLLGDYAVPTGTYVDGLNCDDLKCGLW